MDQIYWLDNENNLFLHSKIQYIDIGVAFGGYQFFFYGSALIKTAYFLVINTYFKIVFILHVKGEESLIFL